MAVSAVRQKIGWRLLLSRCPLRVCPPRGEDIPSSSRSAELSAFSLLPFSLSGASHARQGRVGFRVAFSFHLWSLSGYTSLCHCGLTNIRHSSAQVTGAAIQWCDTGMHSPAADDSLVLQPVIVERTSSVVPNVQSSLR